MDLQEIGEFGFIRRIKKKFSFSSTVPIGMGDDTAAILPSGNKYLLLTTDSLLESVHFDLSFSSFYQIGCKAVSVNVSDVAAMGGVPRYFLISLGLNKRVDVGDLDRFYRGIQKGARESGTELIGGNTAFSKGPFFISLTMVGEVPRKEVVKRSGAKVGDALYVTGTLGSAAAGLEILKKGISPKLFPQLVRQYQTPKARWREGRLLSKKAIASAMIDLSDGLAPDLSHLVEESGVGAELNLKDIPMIPSLRRYALQSGRKAVEYALRGGEDYELLFSVPQNKIRKLESCIQDRFIRATRIGTITEGGLTARIEGKLQRIEPQGYDHFKRRGR
jgi:thiamine-monophosphate kinase